MGYLEDVQKLLAGSGQDQEAPPVMPDAAPSPNAFSPQMVNSYVAQKYGLDQRRGLEDKIDSENQGPNWSAALSALGTGLAGGDAAKAGAASLAAKANEQNNRLSQFDKNAGLEQSQLAAQKLAANDKNESDPNSDSSKIAQSLALQMGIDPTLANSLTAKKFKELSPVLRQKYEIETRKLESADKLSTNKALRSDSIAARQAHDQDRAADRADRAQERQDKIDLAGKEKEYKLTTPYGLANDEDDAKKLKEASESKANFDNKIQQMISLREKHHGGSTLDREDVERGKQLSKDLLLEYKNMAKLGVLSSSDEKIINAIIPEDPLKYNSPLDFIQGQDPTLARLKSFKSDSDKDFANKVATRVRDKGASYQSSNSAPPPPATTGPKSGDIEDGYQFKGGDPKDPANWQQIKDTQMAQRGQ